MKSNLLSQMPPTVSADSPVRIFNAISDDAVSTSLKDASAKTIKKVR